MAKEEQEQLERRSITLKDYSMWILGDERVIPEVSLTVDQKGNVCMSFDEYNRISEYVYFELKKRRKVRYK